MASGFGFGFNSLNNSDLSTCSIEGNNVSLNDDSLQYGNVLSDETIGNSGQRPLFNRPFGSEHSMLQGSYPQFHQPFVHTQHGSPRIIPMTNQDGNSQAYHLNRSDWQTEHRNNSNSKQNQWQQIPLAIVDHDQCSIDISEANTLYGSPRIVSMMNQDGNSQAYHLNRSECNTNRIPMPDSCLFSEKEPFLTRDSHALSYQSFNYRSNYYQATFSTAIQMPYATPSTNSDIFHESQRFFENKYDAIEVPCSTNEPLSGNEININQDLHPSTSQSLGSTSCLLQYGGPDTVQDTYLHSRNFPGSDCHSSSNINYPSFVAESSSNRRLSSSMIPGYESSGSHQLNTVAFPPSESDDITIIKDLHPSSYSDFTIKRNFYPSSYRQSDNVHVKTDGLYSPKESIGNQFFNSQVLEPLTHQPVQSEDSDIHYLNPIIRQLPPKDSDTHRVTELQAEKSEASILRSVLSSNQQPMDASAPKDYRLNYFFDKISPDRFVTMEELLKLFRDFSKTDAGFCLNNIKNVNIFVVGLRGCETTRLVDTLARNSDEEILNTFGLAFQKSINIPHMNMTVKCWNLQNSESFADMRKPEKSTRNAIILVYDVTQKIDVHAIRPEIESVKLANLPILLVGDTSSTITKNPEESIGSTFRLVLYEDGRLMKDLYNFSKFFEFSTDSATGVNGLFITAIDIAFRHEMKIDV